MTGVPPIPAAVQSIGEALLIGLLVGFQREASQTEKHAGFRDFILIALTGGICGLLQSPWLTVAALISIAVLLAVFHFQVRERTGITTEMAAVATFCLGYLTASPQYPGGATLAIMTTIVMVGFLEAKRVFQRLIRETITGAEFDDTLRFLAIIFIIYPLLPEEAYGPYQFFSPRRVWLFVILVSSISYLGYFLEKFLGARRSTTLTGVLGGVASTTAATAAFARNAAENPAALNSYWHGVLLANAVQFPRVLAILEVVNQRLAEACLWPLLAMSAAGLLFALVVLRLECGGVGGERLPLGNPFRLKPALKYGLMFTAILLASKAAAVQLGGGAVCWTSTVAGLVDVDAVVVSLSDLLSGGKVPMDTARLAVLAALAANAVFKSLLAAWAGTRAFAWRTAAGFAVMFAAGAAMLAAGF